MKRGNDILTSSFVGTSGVGGSQKDEVLRSTLLGYIISSKCYTAGQDLGD